MSEWAEQNRWLSTERSAEPGRFRPWAFQREPMDVLSPSDPTEFVIFNCASQMLKTTAYENAIGTIICNDPGPILLIQPRESDAKEFSKKSIDPMFRDTPALVERVVAKKSRDIGNTMEEKLFRGGSLTMLGAQTPENFQMRSVRYAFGDEVSRWPRTVDKEGSPVRLFIMRTANYRGIRKVALASTPTLEGECTITEWFRRSDQRYYEVPCPFCGHYQALEWEQVKWGDEIGIPAGDAHYKCISCEQLIPNWRKMAMIDNGSWVKRNPVSKIAGFHLSRLYSPKTPWGELAEEFLAVRNDDGEHQTFVNTKLARTWKVRGEAPDWEKIASRAEDYEKGTCPNGVLLLTAGADVQRDRIEVRVGGWGRGKQRWLVDYRVFWGDTSRIDSEPWQQLTALLSEDFPHESGARLSIVRMAVDSGDQTTQVYDWGRRQAPGKVIVIKGYDNMYTVLGSPKTSEPVGKRKKRGVLVWPVGVSKIKSELYGILRMEKPGPGEDYPPGWFHHYRESDDWYKQLTAERYVQEKNRNGLWVGRWVKTGRNEALDTTNYDRAAGEHVGVSKFTDLHWRKFEESLHPAPQPTRAPRVLEQSSPEPLTAAPEKPKRRGIVGGVSW